MALPDSPKTREEEYLASAATGGGTIPEYPVTREEMYLNKIATGDGAVPDMPLTRKEMYLAEIAENGGGGTSGLSESVKQALLQVIENVAYTTQNGESYYQALYDALYPSAPPAELVSISAVFTQGSAVIYDSDSLNTLKQYLVVTATYDDESSETVSGYTLSGTLTAGTSTITVSYNGKTTTFNVIVTHSTAPTITDTGHYLNNSGQMISNSDWCVTDYYSTHYVSLPYTLVVSCGVAKTTNAPKLCTYNASKEWVNFYDLKSDSNTLPRELSWKSSDPPSFFRSSLPNDGVSSSYAYVKETGVIIYAGQNSPYFGMSNISEAE